MKTFAVSLGVLLTLALSNTSYATQATSAPCTPSKVIVSAIVPVNATVNNGGNNNANRYLSLNCVENGAFFIVYSSTSNTTNVDANNATGCFVDIDLMKMWESLAVSAELSGHTLTIYSQSVSLNSSGNNCPSSGTQPIMALMYQ